MYYLHTQNSVPCSTLACIQTLRILQGKQARDNPYPHVWAMKVNPFNSLLLCGLLFTRCSGSSTEAAVLN